MRERFLAFLAFSLGTGTSSVCEAYAPAKLPFRPRAFGCRTWRSSCGGSNSASSVALQGPGGQQRYGRAGGVERSGGIPRGGFGSGRASSLSLEMVSYEDLQEKLPSQSVIDAVESSLSGDKVVASDVAAAAGVSLSQARRDLTALASISRGDIAVSSDGELIYTFPAGLSAALAQNSAKYKALQTFRKVWPALFWFVRVSFGVALLVSVAAIFSTIFFLQTSSSSDDDRRDNDRGGGFGMNVNYLWGPSPFDFFFYRPYGYYGYYGAGAAEGERRDPEEMGFLESVFSYIFGDGDPNAGLEEKRLSLAANVIRENKGAVTAEQLAPFCDEAPEPSSQDLSATYVDESFVLPIVTALDGEPRVTEGGEIIYVFPELQTSATSSSSAAAKIGPSADSMVLKRAGLRSDASAREIQTLLNYNGISTRGIYDKEDLMRLLERALPPMTEEEELELMVDSDPTVLQEREWKFSLASDLNKVLAGGLGVVNLGGALYLGNLLGQYALYGVQLPSYFGVVQSLYPLLLAYAILFNVIPLARNFWIGNQNNKIKKRNKIRRNWRSALADTLGAGALGKKLAAARKMRTQMKKLGSSDVLYDTAKPFEDLKGKKEQQSLEEFDKLLENDDNKQK